MIPALSAPVYLSSRSLEQLEALNASSASIRQSIDEVKASVDGVKQAVRELTVALQKQNVASNAEPQRSVGNDGLRSAVSER
ncbi:MAG: hypothetical protein ACRD3C_01230 [Vicinamibacterales bacterium]